ncbi:hypothetical protein ACFLTS_04955 [Chloroflexota bacterium]
MQEDRFYDKLVGQIEERSQAKEELARQLSQLQGQLSVLEDELKELECALSVYNRLTDTATCSYPDPVSPAREYTKATIADICADIMIEAGGHARVRDLIASLQQAGKLTSRDSKVAHATLLKSLQRDNRFERIKRGVFGLKESTS